MIDLNPDWVQISTMGNDLSSLELLKKAGIPAILNGDYLEQHPLGRAEWIKVTGALLGKSNEADSIFRALEKDYLDAIALVQRKNLKRPRVLAGIMYQDVWYLPGGDSWAAKLLESAGADYLFSNIEGTGSAELGYEYVLDRGMDADVWIGVADFPSLEEMGAADRRYQDFKAFQTGEVYTYALKKGPTGGLEYFELGYLRPDWILKDLIKVFHPELLPDYQPYFYQKIDAK
jgi:iron complex transport system substrate-binding protein